MALRDQPYLPLYVQDFITDEKVRECSAATIGVYIYIMCVMHKSDPYGKILLKQKDKQTSSIVQNFAYKLARHLPYDVAVIQMALEELLLEKILKIELDYLIQKRMVKDGEISEKRSRAGKLGGSKSLGKSSKKSKIAKKSQEEFAQANSQANSEYEYEYEYEDNNDTLEKDSKEKPLSEYKPTQKRKKLRELVTLESDSIASKIPELTEFKNYAKEKLGDRFENLEFAIELKYYAWLENGWKTSRDKKGRKIRAWKTTLLNTLPYLKPIKKTDTPPSGSAMKDLMNKHKI